MLKLYPATVALYQELYRQCTLHNNFSYKPTTRDKKLICKFIGWLNKQYKPYQLTEDFLIQYFEFQFSRYAGVVTPKGKNNIMLNWVVGPKAIKEWQNRNINKRYLVTWRCHKDFNLYLKNTFAKVTVNNVSGLLKVNRYEEVSKSRFYNKPTGYVYCGVMTTLYNSNSVLCTGCNFKVECMERLKLSIPKLYELRNG